MSRYRWFDRLRLFEGLKVADHSNLPASQTLKRQTMAEIDASKMIKIYHGSTIAIPAPQLLPTSRSLDFGAGFYTTSDWEQARRWAQIKQRRTRGQQAVVSHYDASAVWDAHELKRKNFLMADVAWLDFVMAHRMQRTMPAATADVIRGPVANDTLYETLALYERGVLTQSETIVRLRTHQLADQIVFKTEQALARLRYVRSEEV